MPRDLEEASKRFEVALKSDIRQHGMNWVEFEVFLGALNSLERHVQSVAINGEVSSFLAAARRSRRLLRSAPLHPSLPEVGLDTLTEFGLEKAVGLTAELCQGVAASAAALQNTDHPAVSVLAKIAKVYPRELIYLIVSGEARIAVKSLNDEMSWPFIVLSPTEVKRSAIGDVAILCGSQEFHESCWHTWEESSRRVSWIFNAPVAHTTLLLQWPGSGTFDEKNYRAIPTVPLRVKDVSGVNKFHYGVNRSVEAASSLAVLPELERLDDRSADLVSAHPVRLPDGRWIFYAAGFRPCANRLTHTDFSLELNEVSDPSNLSPGDWLLIRDEGASREFLEREARAWCEEKHGLGTFDEASGVRARYRDAVLQLARDQFAIKKLVQAGLTEKYAKDRLILAKRFDHIAPSSKSNFERVCRAVGLEVGDKDWSQISRLRTSFQQAGKKATKILEEAVAREEAWISVVNESGCVELDIDEVGSVLIAPVVEVLSALLEMPSSRLGHIFQS